MSYEADGFLGAIAAAPDDDGPRLIYADWLDEQGDPRGRLIRVQIALSKLPAFDRRRGDLARVEEQLLSRYADLWALPFRGLATGPVFKRGFVEEVKVTARQFLSHPDELFRAGPVRHVHLLDGASHIAAALVSPHLARLAGLTVYAQYLREPLMDAVAASPHLGGLRTLHLGRNHVGDTGVRRLLGAGLDSLEHLDLAGNELTDETPRLLEVAARFPHLTRLDLAENALTATGAERLADGRLFPRLDTLRLAANRLGTRGLGPELTRVGTLDLSGNRLTASDVAGLLREPATVLRELDLSDNPFADEGVRALANAPGAAGLRTLRLRHVHFTDDGLAALSQSPRLSRLTVLDISANPLTDGGLQALLRTRVLRHLTRLTFAGPPLSLRTRLALERRFCRG